MLGRYSARRDARQSPLSWSILLYKVSRRMEYGADRDAQITYLCRHRSTASGRGSTEVAGWKRLSTLYCGDDQKLTEI